MLFNHNVNNLNGGISQQVDIARYDNQVEEMVNFVPTVSQGLRRRNPITQVSALATNTNMAIHSYSRGDDIEKYGMIMSDSGLQVFDIDGTPKTVNDFGSTSDKVLAKWVGTDWENDIKFLTVGDTTWILNSSRDVSGIDITVDGTQTGLYELSSDYETSETDVASIPIIDLLTDSTSEHVPATATRTITTEFIEEGTIVDADADGIMNSDELHNSKIRVVYREYTSTKIDKSLYRYTITSEDITEFSSTETLLTSTVVPVREKITLSDNTAFYWIKKSFDDGSGHGYAYQVQVGDFIYKAVDAVITPPMSTAQLTALTGNTYADSIAAAAQLAVIINAHTEQTATARAEGSILFIEDDDDFTFESGDSWGNQASFGWKTSVSKISDLPATMDGFTNAEVGVIAITGTDKDNFTNYYLEWDDVDYFWKESRLVSAGVRIDQTTMPAKLVRQSDGTFSLGWNVINEELEGFHTEWGEREKGDEDSNPIPSFVDSKISNMFFFKNRLGFTSGENVILSQTGSYYNFFASTVMEVLDTDPIDAAADSNNISIIRAVNVTGGAITLWTDTAQFILSGGEVLSPATTRISQTSSYVASPELEPINVDNEILFFNKTGDYLNAHSYAPSSYNSDNSTAISLSAHIPEYIPSTIDIAIAAQSQNMVFLFSSAEPTKLYVYKYHIDNNKRVMSAWFEWTFGITIKKINILEDTLFLISDALYSMPLEIAPVTNTFLDLGTTAYESKVLLSRFHVQTKQNTQYFREKFFAKSVVARIDGSTDLDVINIDRGTTTTTATKHVELERKIIVSSYSDNAKIQFRTSYNNGVAIEALNIEGEAKYRTTNKD